jgi:hypothetical protein
MRAILSSGVLSALMLSAIPAALAAERVVPIEEEPQHILKFRNQHVRFFDVMLPSGYNGQWHLHVNDGVFVNIETSETREHELGTAPKDRPPRTIGQTYFFNYAVKPKIHRVDNTGQSAYRVTDTEILRECGRFAPVQDGTGQTLILENDRVRVTRLMLGPGEKIALHPPCGMLVAVSGTQLLVRAAGGEENITMQPAGFHWREQASALEVVNAGEEVFHGVDILIK